MRGWGGGEARLRNRANEGEAGGVGVGVCGDVGEVRDGEGAGVGGGGRVLSFAYCLPFAYVLSQNTS